MPIISSIHIHILSDLQIDVRKHSTEEKIAKTIPGAAGEKKKSVLKQKKKKKEKTITELFLVEHTPAPCVHQPLRHSSIKLAALLNGI